MSRVNGTLTIGLRALPWLRFVFYVGFGFQVSSYKEYLGNL